MHTPPYSSSSTILTIPSTTSQGQEKNMPQTSQGQEKNMLEISMPIFNRDNEEVCKSLSQYSSISAVKPSCIYNIFRVWFGDDGIQSYMLWANLIQDKRLNPSSNVHLIIDSEDHSEITNKKINDLSKEFGIHLLDINSPINSDNAILTSKLVEEIKHCKNDKRTCSIYRKLKDLIQVSIFLRVPYCALFDIDTRLLKPIDEIVSQRETAFNNRNKFNDRDETGKEIECEHEFHKIIVRMEGIKYFKIKYQLTVSIMLDAFINARKDLISSDEITLYNIESYPCLHIQYAENKKTAFNCFDNDCDILTVPINMSHQDKEEIYERYLSNDDRATYKQQKELIKPYLSPLF